MITDVKNFGSYQWINPTSLYQDEEAVEESECDDDCALTRRWTLLPLLSKQAISKDTSIFTFSLPDGKLCLNLPVGSYLLIRTCEDGDIRPYTSISDDDEAPGQFQVLVKRYDPWGIKESPETHFLFTRTDHSYRPAGRVSTFLHSLEPGTRVWVRLGLSPGLSRTRLPWPLPGVRSLTMIAVGVGIAPMIQILRHVFRSHPWLQVSLLYGAREAGDLLLRPLLDHWAGPSQTFRVVYCLGSRWANIHFGAKKAREYEPPPAPEGFSSLAGAGARVELGWIDEDKIRRHGFAPAEDGRVLVCGLPGVYHKICGPRTDTEIAPGSALHRLGYTKDMVIKL